MNFYRTQYDQMIYDKSPKIKNPDLCGKCTLRCGHTETPEAAVEISWSKDSPGGIGSVTVCLEVDIDTGVIKPPTGRRSWVGIIGPGVPRPIWCAFKAAGEKIDSGELERRFSVCDGPVRKYPYIFFWKKQKVCGALTEE